MDGQSVVGSYMTGTEVVGGTGTGGHMKTGVHIFMAVEMVQNLI